jgi:hypothetical protein
VRIAFIAENQSGNNIFIDNIEFFVSDNENPFDPGSKPYEVYWTNGPASANITFNLTEKQPVDFQILDITGRELFSGELTEVLNQTFPLPIGLSAPGLYLVRVHIGNQFYTTKIYLSP